MRGASASLPAVQQLLTQMVDYLRRIAENTSPKRPATREQVRIDLSNVQTQREMPFPRNAIVGLWVGADHSGRATLNFGADSVPLWIFANQTTVLGFTQIPILAVAGGSPVTFTPPAGTTVWDVVLSIEPSGPTNNA